MQSLEERQGQNTEGFLQFGYNLRNGIGVLKPWRYANVTAAQSRPPRVFVAPNHKRRGR